MGHLSAEFLVNDAPEVAHQQRVALRRLRALLWAYRPLLPERFAEQWRQTLGDVATVVGSARDWDIILKALAIAVPPKHPSLSHRVMTAASPHLDDKTLKWYSRMRASTTNTPQNKWPTILPGNRPCPVTSQGQYELPVGFPVVLSSRRRLTSMSWRALSTEPLEVNEHGASTPALEHHGLNTIT